MTHSIAISVSAADVSCNPHHGRQQLHYSVTQLQQPRHGPLDSSDIGSHSHHHRSDLHLSQQEPTRQGSLSVDSLAVRCHDLSADCPVVYRRRCNQIQLQLEEGHEADHNKNYAQLRWTPHISLRCRHNLSWHQSIMERHIRFVGKTSGLRSARIYDFVCYCEKLYSLQLKGVECYVEIELVNLL